MFGAFYRCGDQEISQKRYLDYVNVKCFSKYDWGFAQAMLAIMPCVMTQAVLAGWPLVLYRYRYNKKVGRTILQVVGRGKR